MTPKLTFITLFVLLTYSCSKSSGDSAAADSSTTTPKTILQGSLYFPGKQSAKNIRIYLDSNTNPFDGAATTLSATTNNTISQSYTFDTLTVSGNYYLSAWVDVDNSGTLNAGDYFGWYRGGSNQPTGTNFNVSAATTNTANIVLSTYASTTGTTATATINLPSASTGKDLYVVLDTDQDLSNGWVGGTHIRTDGNTSYAVPIANTPSGSYHMNVFLDNDGNFAKSAGDLYAARNGTATNPIPPVSTTNAYTTTGNTAVAIANTVFRTSSSYSISGTITLGAASPTKVCNILIDQDNNLSNGFTDGVQISCGSSTSVPFTLSLVPTGSFFLATHADNNDTVVNTGDYFGYHNGTGMAAPGAASVTVTAADVASVNLTPQLVP